MLAFLVTLLCPSKENLINPTTFFQVMSPLVKREIDKYFREVDYTTLANEFDDVLRRRRAKVRGGAFTFVNGNGIGLKIAYPRTIIDESEEGRRKIIVEGKDDREIEVTEENGVVYLKARGAGGRIEGVVNGNIIESTKRGNIHTIGIKIRK